MPLLIHTSVKVECVTTRSATAATHDVTYVACILDTPLVMYGIPCYNHYSVGMHCSVNTCKCILELTC